MKTKKLSIQSLEVKSFTTEIKQQVKAGNGFETRICDRITVYITACYGDNQCQKYANP